jgi:hypothetical protein
MNIAGTPPPLTPALQWRQLASGRPSSGGLEMTSHRWTVLVYIEWTAWTGLG